MTTEPVDDAINEIIIGAYVEERLIVVTAGGAAPGRRPRIEITGAALVWGALTALFLALRIAPIWQAPVGGAELVHLSGAWQARIGDADARFVPSLFQALSTLLLHISSSEIGPRIVAFLATASTPAALWLLRPRLGEAGALAALLLLALDAPSIALGTTATAMGFDLAIAVWLLVLVTRDEPVRPWMYGAAAFLVVTSGPLTLPLLGAWATTSLARGARPDREHGLPMLIGVGAGIAAASLRFGLGFDGLRVPAFDLFAASFDERWSTASAADLALLYATPVLLAAAGAATWAYWQSRTTAVPQFTVLLLAWLAFAVAWFTASAGELTPAPVAAMTIPAALLAGPAIIAALGAMWRADWHLARFLVPISAAAVLFASAIISDWGQVGAVGGTEEGVMAGLLIGVAGIAALAVAIDRRSAPALVSLGLGIALFPVLAATMGVALSAGGEPIPSPISPVQARELRDIALARMATSEGGTIVVNPAFADDITWAFRESGDITIASRVPENAVFAIWPSDLAPPEGMVPVAGNWALVRHMDAPTSGGFLRYVKWFTHRNAAVITSEPVAVYVRTSP